MRSPDHLPFVILVLKTKWSHFKVENWDIKSGKIVDMGVSIYSWFNNHYWHVKKSFSISLGMVQKFVYNTLRSC